MIETGKWRLKNGVTYSHRIVINGRKYDRHDEISSKIWDTFPEYEGVDSKWTWGTRLRNLYFNFSEKELLTVWTLLS